MAIPSAAAPVDLAQIIDVDRYPMDPTGPRARRLRTDARRQFHETGVCIFDGFLRTEAVEAVLSEIDLCVDQAYVSTTSSTVFLEPGSNLWPPGFAKRT
jgi:transglutaminase-like putative cysteine protease